MRTTILLLLTLLAAGCYAPVDGPTPYPETVEENPLATAPAAPIRVCVDVADQAKVYEGVRAWAKVLAPWRGVEVYTDACDLLIVEVALGERCEADASACVDTIGGLDRARPSGALYLVRGRYETNPALSVIHEMGHLLGLDHEDGGVMQAAPTASMWGGRWDCPDLTTIEALEAHLSTSLGRCAQ
jgi:hypothetical protein